MTLLFSKKLEIASAVEGIFKQAEQDIANDKQLIAEAQPLVSAIPDKCLVPFTPVAEAYNQLIATHAALKPTLR